MIIAVPKETHPGERRVAVVPAVVPRVVKLGYEVSIEHDAGLQAGFVDTQYTEKGARIVDDRSQLFAGAGLVAQVRIADLELLQPGQIVVGLADPLSGGDMFRALAERGVTLLALELLPRITRAQEMDVLSSQANLAGYKAVIRAADLLGKIFPLMMTAAGTVRAAKVFVVGAGVAGLQAIATAKRLGAQVSAFDVRPAVKEQVQSLGAKFVELPIVATEQKGGYAADQSAEQLDRQRQLMARVVAESDVVITTALIQGKPAPKLISRDMIEAMAHGSVIVDLAAEKGGNCELTTPGETIVHQGVQIVGDDKLVAGVAQHASQMYANNIVRYLQHLTKDGSPNLDLSDEITRETLVTRDGEVVHPRVRETLGLPPLAPAGSSTEATPSR